jgi:hypothetical protein
MNVIANVGEGPFPDTPKGRELPIGCTYQFGPPVELALVSGVVEPLYSAPIPDGWEAVKLAADDPEVEAAGFTAGKVWIDDTGRTSPVPFEGAKMVGYSYLRDPEGTLVATWDEGRWWTPEESEAFYLMLRVPGAKDAFGIGADTPKGGITWEEE